MEEKFNSIQINEDFQGWPIYKRTLRHILHYLGVIDELGNVKIDNNDPILDSYPQIMEDDGMGYSPYVRYITESEIYNGTPRFWIDYDIKDLKKKSDGKDKIDSHKFYRLDWPEVQEFMGEEWFLKESHYDCKNNCWFIPYHYVYE